MQLLTIGKGEVTRQGTKFAILSFGTMLDIGIQVANTIDATLCNMRFIKPLDIDLIKEVALNHDYIVTLEENVVMGGAGSACNEALQELGILKPVLNLGVQDDFPPHGDQKILMKKEGLDVDGILLAIKKRFGDA